MPDVILDKLKPLAAERIKPFLTEILSRYEEKIHSIHITGTAITDDFNPKISDLNSILTLKEMDLKILGFIAPLGKKYRKHGVAAPLIMTPEYMKTSLDVFPLEFLNFKLIHATVLGEDLLENIEINMKDLRHQCERELKTKLIALRQSYISSLGNGKMLTQSLVDSISGYISLFRGIIVLLGKEPPVTQDLVIKTLAGVSGINTGAFNSILMEKYKKINLHQKDLPAIFEEYYTATEKLGRIVDEITI